MATTLFRPDQTFYPSPRLAAEAPAETLAYMVTFDPTRQKPDGLVTVDVDPKSKGFGKQTSRVDAPNVGDEFHHFGWNVCSSALCPYAAHPHLERRYLLVPGLRSSRIYIFDVKADPKHPKLVHTIEAKEIADRAGYSRPHTIHCGPDGIYVSALGNPDGDTPGGVFVIDHDTFAVKGRWELDRGPQRLAYDFWWHLGYDTAITSEWGTPKMVEGGVNPEILLAGEYGHKIHIWDLPKRRHRQEIDLGKEYQMVLELRPAHDPSKAYGFVGVVTSLKDLSASIWTWYLDGSTYKIEKVIDIPAEPADPDDLPPLLKGFKAVPPLVTDINLSLDDRALYVSAWGTGESSGPLSGGPQMVELSRDGKRAYLTNSLYASWDEQFYPDGIKSWATLINAKPGGGLSLDGGFFTTFEQRTHQIHLEGGDASSDSYCYS